MFEFEGFGEVTVGSRLLCQLLRIGVRGKDDDRNIFCPLVAFELLRDFTSVSPDKRDVEVDHVRCGFFYFLNTGECLGYMHVVLFEPQGFLHGEENSRIVVDDKHFFSFEDTFAHVLIFYFADAIGSVKKNVEPSPSLLSTHMRPLCWTTMASEIWRPIPKPEKFCP